LGQLRQARGESPRRHHCEQLKLQLVLVDVCLAIVIATVLMRYGIPNLPDIGLPSETSLAPRTIPMVPLRGRG
jgi:hypothetical protein